MEEEISCKRNGGGGDFVTGDPEPFSSFASLAPPASGWASEALDIGRGHGEPQE